ncbi:MAG: hypothetical protein ACD_2C00210G0001, partial [uncultured bacterium (gcode 4)]
MISTSYFFMQKSSKKHWGRKRYLSVFRKYAAFTDDSAPKPLSVRFLVVPLRYSPPLRSGPLGMMIANVKSFNKSPSPIGRGAG